MFKSRLPIQDEEAGVMRVIMTPVATGQGLPSPGAFLGRGGLSGSQLLAGSTGGLAGMSDFKGVLP